MKAVCYYRVSTPQQKEKQSIEMQKLRLYRFAAEKRYEIVEEFQDDGISGEAIDSRPGFQKCLEKIAEGDIDVLLVFMIDRIGRFASRKDRNRVIELLEDTQTSVNSPYHDLVRWDNEKRMNDLEGSLNESRLENVMRGIRVSEGHLAHRLAGKPRINCRYGIRQDKETGKFYIVPQEIETLRVMFSKLASGWGRKRTGEFLDQDPEKYPLPNYTSTYRKDIPIKGIKKGDPKERRWSTSTIGKFVKNDFYFTGVIQPTPAAKDKDFTPIDTGLKDKLFTEEEVMLARRESRVKRQRKPGQTVLTDALLHGIAQCGYCGWNLSRNPDRSRLYYRCYGNENKSSLECEFSQIQTTELDRVVWAFFAAEMSDPDAMCARIRKHMFIHDKDRIDLEAFRDKAHDDFKAAGAEHTRLNRLFVKGNITEAQYEDHLQDIKKRLEKAADNYQRSEQTLKRPKEVEKDMKRAADLVAEQLKVLWTLNELKEMLVEIEGVTDVSDLKTQASNEKEKVLFEMWASQKTIDLHTKVAAVLEDLKSGATVSKAELSVQAINQLIFQQKRAILQSLVDPEYGVEVRSSQEFIIHLAVARGDGDDREIIKSLAHCAPRQPRFPKLALRVLAPSPH